MLNTKYVFRCKASGNTMKPEYMFDVEGMRKHPEYEEIDAKGNVVELRDFEAVQRPLMHPDQMLGKGLSADVKAKKR
jgi:hypothetical protein